ncbi:hypothetical protein GCM10022211_15810 [Sphingomonas humi]|uniref:Uncharacterized protein n=1 Tax=Sphingomonas humi TaxID=335630 RepID=A0ABP7S082_9SPHN
MRDGSENVRRGKGVKASFNHKLLERFLCLTQVRHAFLPNGPSRPNLGRSSERPFFFAAPRPMGPPP